MRSESHISDEELILAMDGELTEARSSVLEEHLVACWKCRIRRAELESAIGAYIQFTRSELDPQIPDGRGPSARLQAQMERMTDKRSRVESWIPRLRRMATPLLVGSALLVFPVLLFIWLAGELAVAAGPLPNSRLTPGAIRYIARKEVCSLSAQDEGRRIPVGLAMEVFRQYKIEKPRGGEYEVDFLISPSLGGAEDIRNLWPQPYHEGVWNSRVKDALEDHLRQMVCDGRLDLASAQWEIANNWIAAYRKYFHTDRPIAAHALFIKDHPWE
jgi:hypothetical protein